MRKISEIVENIIEGDDIVKAIASRGLLNSRAYARTIQKEIEKELYKDVKLGSITTAVSRYISEVNPIKLPPQKDIQQISVQTNLDGITYERSEETSTLIQKIYKSLSVDHKTYLTVTQGINEITIIAETSIIDIFRKKLDKHSSIYDISNIVGITIKFGLKYMEIPNLFYFLIQKLALKDINIIEIVSTATEVTFIIDKKDLSISLDQFQKGI